MNKKLVGGIIAIIAVVALVVVFVVTRPDSSKDMDMSNSKNQNETTQKAAETNEVSIKGFAFSPATITVKKGTTVTWTNEDSVQHTITGNNGGPSSELIGQGDTYTYTFNEVGTFDYHCKPHPSMVGKVVVEE